MKIAVLYAYYEKNESYKENLRHFLKYGLIPTVDTLVISNGSITVDISDQVTLLSRENAGADFGAWNHGIKHLIQNGKTYDYYFFINTSVRGPFMPKYSEGKCTWLDAYMELFTEGTHLVGATICILHSNHDYTPLVQNLSSVYGFSRKPPYTHVQSMFFGMTKEGLDYIWNKGIFSYSGKTLLDTVLNQEIVLSTLILDKGWNINCMLDKFRDVDYRQITTDCDTLGINGDLWFQNAYFGKNIHPYEVIFFKNNRLPLLEYDVFTNAKFRIYTQGNKINESDTWISINKKYIPDFTFDVAKEDGTLPAIRLGSESRVCQLSHDFFYKYDISRLRMALECGKPTVVFNMSNSNDISFLTQCEKIHKGFTVAWTTLLDKLGLVNWALAPIIYFPNNWILSKDRYLMYQTFLNNVYSVVANNKELKAKLGHMLPFIYERLPCLYFYMNRFL